MTVRRVLVVVIVLWLVTAYFALPRAWVRREDKTAVKAATAPGQHDVSLIPRRSVTNDSIPGDPVNLVFVGSKEQVVKGLLAAGWHPADPITIKSSIEIGAASVFHRSYDDAPVSPLYVWGKPQDLAFEFPFGEDPSKRHHVRLWSSPRPDSLGRPLWAAGATFDQRVGLSHTTAEITHHIAPGVDAERDNVLEDLRIAGAVAELDWFDGFQKERTGKNGGGDPYFTDGRLAIVIVADTVRALPAPSQ